jgi:hypothetical protein
MKQTEGKVMETMQETQGYMPDWDQIANLDAWEGYEFWSSQLEAEMEMLEGLATNDSFNLVQLERKEGKSNVLPF